MSAAPVRHDAAPRLAADGCQGGPAVQGLSCPACLSIWLASHGRGYYTYQIAIGIPVMQGCTTGNGIAC
jgi:hypothetical protein